MRKLKILFVIWNLKFGGGAPKIVSILGEEFKNKFDFDIYYLSFYNLLPLAPNITQNYFSFCEELKEGNSFKKINELSVPQKLSRIFNRTIIRSIKLKKLCEKVDIDIVISFMEDSNLISLFSKIFFRNKSKLLISVRSTPDLYGEEFFTFENIFFKQILIKRLYPFVDGKIICVSKKIENSLIKLGLKQKKLVTIYNPLDIEKYLDLATFTIEDQFKVIFENNFIFLNIGSLEIQKGQNHLIKSFSLALKDIKNTKLIIIGEGKIKSKLEQIIKKLNLDQDVLLLGNRKNVFPYLKKANAFIFSSLWEGLPNALMETLIINIPIVSTDCNSGPREILAPELEINQKIKYPYFSAHGILVSPFEKKIDDKGEIIDYNEKEKILAEIMIELYKNKLLRESYSKNFARAKSFYFKIFINKWKEQIDSLLK